MQLNKLWETAWWTLVKNMPDGNKLLESRGLKVKKTKLKLRKFG